MRLFRGILLLVAQLVFASAACACDWPVPFEYVFQNNVTSSLSGATTCALTVSTTAASRTTAAAFLHYRRSTRLTSVRFGFRIDASGLSSGAANQMVSLFSATSPVVVSTVSNSTVLRIQLRLGTPRELLFMAGDTSLPSGAKAVTVPLSASINTVRVEINVGTPGGVSYWINHAFTDPPDGVVESTPGGGLVNAAFQGVIAAAIGLSNPSQAYRQNHAGESLIFDQVESSDDVLFYDDFSSGAQ